MADEKKKQTGAGLVATQDLPKLGLSAGSAYDGKSFNAKLVNEAGLEWTLKAYIRRKWLVAKGDYKKPTAAGQIVPKGETRKPKDD